MVQTKGWGNNQKKFYFYMYRLRVFRRWQLKKYVYEQNPGLKSKLRKKSKMSWRK